MSDEKKLSDSENPAADIVENLRPVMEGMSVTKIPMENNDRVHYMRDNLGEWRWKRVAANGKIVGASSEGYGRLRDARANFQRQSVWVDTDRDVIEIDGEEI